MSRRVFLHVGTPKSGTSYLQDRLARNRDRLAGHGLDYLPTRTGDHFEAALDLIGDRWAGAEKAARGQWDALVTEARRSPVDVLVSHEILAAASTERVRRARDAFARDEVHVVLTARDLGRQVPAEWQERVKHRGRRPYAGFVKRVQSGRRRTDRPMWFWRVQDVPGILTRWGSGLTPDRIHLVTVPQAGADHGVLWDRFGQALGLDPAGFAESETTNASLGGAEVTMLRRLNVELSARRLPRDTYVDWVRETIVSEVLARRSHKQRTSVPPRLRPWVEDVTAEWLEWLTQSGVHVIGDLEELRPVWPDDNDGWWDPDQADAEDVADAAIESLAHVLAQVAQGGPSPVSRLARRLRS